MRETSAAALRRMQLEAKAERGELEVKGVFMKAKKLTRDGAADMLKRNSSDFAKNADMNDFIVAFGGLKGMRAGEVREALRRLERAHGKKITTAQQAIAAMRREKFL